MTFVSYTRLLRKRWRIIVTCVLIGLGLAIAFVVTATPKYEASTQLFVAAQGGTDSTSLGLFQEAQFSEARVQSYADIIHSLPITTATSTALNDGLRPSQIASRVSADAKPNTVVLNVHATDTSPARAQAIANTISSQFATYAGHLETTPGTKASPVKVTVVNPASLPTHPVSPKKALDVIAGLFFGLLAGLGGAVIRDQMDTTVKAGDDLGDSLGLSVLGAIAFDSDARRSPLIVGANPRSSRAEAFRQLRTNLRFLDVDNAPKSICITSSVPAEGKTTTAANTAILLAQSGLRVMLVEADLRRGRIADYLGIDGAVGLTSVLVGTVSLDDATQAWGDGGLLSVLPGGPIPPNPSELLGSQTMADLLIDLESRYDLVVIDTPPLLPVTDAAVLAPAVSGTLVVVRHGSTRRHQINMALASLRSVDAHIYGVVVTMVPSRGPEAYHYGYSYKESSVSKRGHADLVTLPPRGRPSTGDSSEPANGGTPLPANGSSPVTATTDEAESHDSPNGGVARLANGGVARLASRERAVGHEASEPSADESDASHRASTRPAWGERSSSVGQNPRPRDH